MRGLLVSIFIFLIVGLIGWIALYQITTPAILDQAVTQVPSGGGGEAELFDLDSTTSTQGQFETYLEDIADGLLKWIFSISVLGCASTLAWFSWSLALQRKVVGPSGQNSAFPAWVALALVYVLGCGFIYAFVISPLHINEAMDDTTFYIFIFGGVLSGLASYWATTRLAATPVMKPSVPFAAWKRGS
jgi:hypothetical protein